VCLLAVVFRVHADSPLIVAANRDEWLERPSEPMQVLRLESPRVLGGRDKLASGTWLAINEHGVVAGLTNRPMRGGRDPKKRSRGLLPLLLTEHRTAADAVAAIEQTVSPADYNPCWMLVGDRESLFYLDLTGGSTPGVRPLAPGIHVLENCALDAGSRKTEAMVARLQHVGDWHACELVDGLARALGNHSVPKPPNPPKLDGIELPAAIEAACVHAGPYGTRSSTIVVLPAQSEHPPMVLFADGAPCKTELVDVTYLWHSLARHSD
jgi:uncharacterized protein with NRDE domain